ncbi:hypothetical protein HYS84_00500 [Candidatus Saccharibacteria bacterium]|nr:hypothetical protein [Candidatus Saccharibacteria bacterium]
MSNNKKTIVICSSANFYKHALEVSEQLKEMGYKTLVPITIKKMKRSGNFNASDYRIWFKNPDAFKRKTYLMRNHFNKIAKSDAVLVVNDEKRGIKGYIGANVLMEMGLALHLGKLIYIFNGVPADSPIYEEVRAMQSKIINGDLSKIKL